MKLTIELELNNEFPNRYLGALHVIEQSIRDQHKLTAKPQIGDGGPLVDGAGGKFGRWEVAEDGGAAQTVIQAEPVGAAGIADRRMTRAEKLALLLNEHREAAAVALVAYGKLNYPGDDPIEFYWVSDLMADLHHLADREAWDWDELIAKAERHYQAEIDGEDVVDDEGVEDAPLPTRDELLSMVRDGKATHTIDRIHHDEFVVDGKTYLCAWESPSERFKIPEGRWVTYSPDESFEASLELLGPDPNETWPEPETSDVDVATPTAPEQAIDVSPSKGKDAFLDDATHELRDRWELRGGATLGEHELDALNDTLTAFFADKEL